MRKGSRGIALTQPVSLFLVERKPLPQGIARDPDVTIVESWDTSRDIVMSLPSPKGCPKTEGEVFMVRLPITTNTPVRKELVYL
jgi:hypothetical protein